MLTLRPRSCGTGKLSSEQKDEECDARDDDSSTTAGFKKNLPILIPFVIQLTVPTPEF
jgi:hypothetical protein